MKGDGQGGRVPHIVEYLIARWEEGEAFFLCHSRIKRDVPSTAWVSTTRELQGGGHERGGPDLGQNVVTPEFQAGGSAKGRGIPQQGLQLLDYLIVCLLRARA